MTTVPRAYFRGNGCHAVIGDDMWKFCCPMRQLFDGSFTRWKESMHFREGTKACLFSVLPLTAPLVCLLRYQEKDNDNVPKLWYGTYHNHTIPTTALEKIIMCSSVFSAWCASERSTDRRPIAKRSFQQKTRRRCPPLLIIFLHQQQPRFLFQTNPNENVSTITRFVCHED